MPRTLNRQAGSRATYAFSPAYADVWARGASPHSRSAAGDHRAGTGGGVRLPAQLPLVVIKEVDDSHAADVVMSLFPRSRMLLSRARWTRCPRFASRRQPSDRVADEGGVGFRGVRQRAGEACMDTRALPQLGSSDERLPASVRSARRRSAPARVLRGRARRHHRVSDGSQSLARAPATSEEIRRIAAAHSFAALPDYAKGPGMFRRSANPGSWREGLAEEQQDFVQEIMGELLVELGPA